MRDCRFKVWGLGVEGLRIRIGGVRVQVRGIGRSSDRS